MKIKTLLIAAFSLATTAISQAFTIDFNALVVPVGTTITADTPLTIEVAGYGDVQFQVPATDVVEVGTTFANHPGTSITNSLELDAGDTVVVTFLGPEVLDVDFDLVGITPGEEFVQITQNAIRTFEFQVNSIGNEGTDGVGIAAVSFTSVPEPSSALLGLLGACAMVFRRNR